MKNHPTFLSMNNRTSLELTDVAKNTEYMMLWYLNKKCNMNCGYCFFDEKYRKNESKHINNHTIDHIVDCFDNSKKKWTIVFSGGENFLHPQFIELVNKITVNHNIIFSSNLLSNNVYEFAKKINPTKILVLYANLHIQEREKIKNGYEDFINKCLFFQDKGFNIVTGYVAHPTLMSRMDEDLNNLQKCGIKKVSCKTFKGVYKDRIYPLSYTEKEKDLIKKWAYDQIEIYILNKTPSTFNRLCAAGYRYFKMDYNGDIYRCDTLSKYYGNFFTGTFHPDTTVRPCPVKRCNCEFTAAKYTINKKGPFLQLAKEIYFEKFPLKKNPQEHL